MRGILKINYIIILCFFIFVNLHLAAEQKVPQQLDLYRINDDLKYQNGLEFFNLENYERAAQEFEEYLEIHYDGVHRHEAWNHLALIAFKRFDYNRAAEIYMQLYREFSTTESGVNGYLHAGFCYDKMGFEQKARRIYSSIVDLHPESPSAKQARVHLDLLKIISE